MDPASARPPPPEAWRCVTRSRGPASRPPKRLSHMPSWLLGYWQHMPNVVGCLLAGAVYAGVWAGPTDLQPEARPSLIHAAPPLPPRVGQHGPLLRVTATKGT